MWTFPRNFSLRYFSSFSCVYLSYYTAEQRSTCITDVLTWHSMLPPLRCHSKQQRSIVQLTKWKSLILTTLQQRDKKFRNSYTTKLRWRPFCSQWRPSTRPFHLSFCSVLLHTSTRLLLSSVCQNLCSPIRGFNILIPSCITPISPWLVIIWFVFCSFTMGSYMDSGIMNLSML